VLLFILPKHGHVTLPIAFLDDSQRTLALQVREYQCRLIELLGTTRIDLDTVADVVSKSHAVLPQAVAVAAFATDYLHVSSLTTDLKVTRDELTRLHSRMQSLASKLESQSSMESFAIAPAGCAPQRK